MEKPKQFTGGARTGAGGFAPSLSAHKLKEAVTILTQFNLSDFLSAVSSISFCMYVAKQEYSKGIPLADPLD